MPYDILYTSFAQFRITFKGYYGVPAADRMDSNVSEARDWRVAE